MPNHGSHGFSDADLANAWRDAATALPEGVDLCVVAYHGPDSLPNREWIAIACDDASGSSVGPEGVGADPFAALQSLVEFMRELKS